MRFFGVVINVAVCTVNLWAWKSTGSYFSLSAAIVGGLCALICAYFAGRRSVYDDDIRRLESRLG